MTDTLIQWTDKTLNCVTGCTQLSTGCANCYAKRKTAMLEKNPKTDKYRQGFKVTLHPECLEEPTRWRKPAMIFLNSMSDTFHVDVPLDYLRAMFDMIARKPRHTFQVLTKRAERLAELSDKLPWPQNLWIGVTVERADYLFRMDLLRSVPAEVRFVSFEPLLGPIPNINFDGIHWAIVGGESGPNARPMDLQWARDIHDQCISASVPFFFKQVGSRGRDKGGRLLDGREWSEYPQVEQ